MFKVSQLASGYGQSKVIHDVAKPRTFDEFCQLESFLLENARVAPVFRIDNT